MTSFSLAVRVPADRFRARGNDLFDTLLDMMARYDDGPDETESLGMWSSYAIDNQWALAYPVKPGSDPSLVLCSVGTRRSSALRRAALDIEAIHEIGITFAQQMCMYWNTGPRSAFEKQLGQGWIEAIKEARQTFVEKYAACFNPYIPSAFLDEQGWVTLEKPGTKNMFGLGSPEQALQNAQQFEAHILRDTNPDDVLVRVRCERAA